MIFREQAPSSDLAAVIDRFWYFEPEAIDPESYEHVIVPEGTAGLCLIEPIPQIGAFISLTGPAERAVRVPVQRGLRYWGLRLRTGAIRAVLGLEAETLTNGMVYLLAAVPVLGAEMMAACCGASSLTDFAARFEAVARRHVQPDRLDSTVCEMVRRIHSGDGFTPLAEIVTGFDIGERQLRRRFLKETGLTPKIYARLRRVRRAVLDLAYERPKQVAAVSYDHGYADQPHFTRELKAVFDLSPHQLSAYLHQIRLFNVRDVDDVRNLQAGRNAAE
ncbi:araC family transcriptional regulator [Asticcacaulis biprosthecium C19]|uniref:AraC family transcriptional regulator n=1 Tax=Asticcacaulis biprosthecium C19 TaxID=715226 RepID=F4QST2_9CAUL|nr:AraC family transcriptional regulator [Asticcacaulis biprosthecium]EGF89802.1 araC family transcriptional regulator [Asticcacaulis biprosthecium C19]